MFRSGLMLRISVAFAGVACLLLGGVGVLSYNSGRSALQSAAVSELLFAAIGKESHINEWRRNLVSDIETLAASPVLQNTTARLIANATNAQAVREAHDQLSSELLPHTQAKRGRHLTLAIADARTGTLIASTEPSLEGKSFSKAAYFNAGLLKSYVQSPFIPGFLNRPVIAVSTPIRGSNNSVSGVLMAWIDLAELNNIVQQRNGDHQTDDAYLVNVYHQLVTLPRFLKPAVALVTKIHTEAAEHALSGHSGVLLASDYSGLPAIIVYRWLPSEQMGLISLITQDEALTLVNEFRLAIVVISVFLLLLAVGLSIVVARTIVQPIRTLQEGVSRFGQGEFTLRLPVTSDNELGQLAREFNNMAASINQKGRELQQNASQLELRVQERTRTLKRQADLLELAHDAIIVRRADGTIDYWNHGAKEVYGWPHNEARGRSIHELLKTRFAVSQEEFDFDLLKAGRWEGELTHTRRDGRTIVVESRQAVRYDDMGKAVAILEINSDITARKFVETQLTRAKEDAEAATNAKSNFLANMSHEIRTPMNGIIGMTNLVLKTPLTERQRDHLGLIKGSADSLQRLLNDILDFSKMEARKLELELVEFDLRKMIGTTLKSFSAMANEKRIELIHHVMPNVPIWVEGDAGRLTQILVNLTGNALKFTKEGEVVVRVVQESCTERNVMLHFSVSDSGIGIPREKQNYIFNAFAQADSSTTREYGGTGLGLAIVAQLVELMQGKIWLDSALGQGTTFHFTVNLRLSNQARQRRVLPAPALAGLADLPILVVDDNRTNRMVLADVLSSWSMRPVLASDGAQAMQLLIAQHALDRPFALMLLDARMLGSSGFDVAETLKAHFDLAPTTIMMLSASDLDEDIARCRQLGINNFVHKPVQQSALLDAIATATGIANPKRVIDAPHSPPLQPQSRVLHVLVAEDNGVNQRLLSDILEDRGHTFMVANNGLETVALCERHHFDVILMDGQMPEMDGYQATREIRQREQGTDRHVRIIAVTANAMKEDRAVCIAAGMDDYITKPIDADDLIARIEWQSENERSSVTAIDNQPQAVPASSAVVFNRQGALKRVRGKVSLLKELLTVLVQDLPNTLAEIDSAIANNNAEQLERAAHRMLGAVSTICADAVTEVVTRIEHLGRAKTLASAPQAAEHLHLKVADLMSEMHIFLEEPA